MNNPRPSRLMSFREAGSEAHEGVHRNEAVVEGGVLRPESLPLPPTSHGQSPHGRVYKLGNHKLTLYDPTSTKRPQHPTVLSKVFQELYKMLQQPRSPTRKHDNPKPQSYRCSSQNPNAELRNHSSEPHKQNTGDLCLQSANPHPYGRAKLFWGCLAVCFSFLVGVWPWAFISGEFKV